MAIITVEILRDKLNELISDGYNRAPIIFVNEVGSHSYLENNNILGIFQHDEVESKEDYLLISI